MGGVLLSESVRRETADAIEDLISRGNPDEVAGADTSVLVECARRYLSDQLRLRERASSRHRERYAKVREEANAKLRDQTRQIVESLTRELHREWEASLLLGEFSLPDGSRVTWAEATSAQHERRAEHLEALASGDMQTAAIHRRAVRDIREAGVTKLAEVVS